MTFLKIRERRVTNYSPANHQVTATTQLIQMHAGELVIAAFCRITVAFDGGSSDAALDLGDAGSTNRFIASADLTETTLGLYQGSGAGLADDLGHLYTADDTIDVVFTRDTGVDGTEGSADFWIWYIVADPP